MLVALLMLVAVWVLLTRTRIGLIIQAALTHPEMTEALGHNVPRVFMGVFGGGAALAGLAGVIGGNTYVTEPAMAAAAAAGVSTSWNRSRSSAALQPWVSISARSQSISPCQ